MSLAEITIPSVAAFASNVDSLSVIVTVAVRFALK
jgi:hypothetical protein